MYIAATHLRRTVLEVESSGQRGRIVITGSGRNFFEADNVHRKHKRDKAMVM